MRKISMLCLMMIPVMLLTGLNAALAEAAPEYTVVATNFVCYDFARQVAGPETEVTLLIDPGTEVHAYEPSPADIMKIAGVDLFVYIGGESDVWAEEILSSFGSDAPAALRLMAAVTPLEEVHEAGHEESDQTLEYDEHIWTSPVNARAMVAMVRDGLCAMNPEGAAAYGERAEDYMARIDAIDGEIRALVDGARVKTLVVADRFPFLYMVTEYGLRYIAAYPTCASDMEPSAQTVAEMISAISKDGIKVIYTIEMSNGAIARTLSEETGAEILTLYSAQNVTLDDFRAGVSYVSLMEANVNALRRGLE